jgi:hypothetical protein
MKKMLIISFFLVSSSFAAEQEDEQANCNNQCSYTNNLRTMKRIPSDGKFSGFKLTSKENPERLAPEKKAKPAQTSRGATPSSLGTIQEEQPLKKVEKKFFTETCEQEIWGSCKKTFAFAGAVASLSFWLLYVDYQLKVNSGYCFPPTGPVW